MYADYVRLARDHPKPLAFGLLHAFFSSPGQTYAVAVLIPFIAADLGLTLTTLGVIYSGISLASAALMPMLGKLIDRVKLRHYSAAIGLAMVAGAVVTACASGAASLAAGLFVLRLTGQGLMTHTGATATARFFGASRGKALGVTHLGMPMGEAVFPAIITGIVALLDWRAAVLVMGGLCLGGFLPASLALSRHYAGLPPPQPGVSAAPTGHSRRDVLTSTFFYRVLPASLVVPFFVTGLIFHQGAIGLEKGWAAGQIGALFFMFALGHASGAFLIGPLTDRIGAARLYPWHGLPFALGALVLHVGATPFAGGAFLLLTGLATGFFSNLITAMFAEVYGIKNLGAIRSMVSTILVFAAALAPAIAGYLLDRGVGTGAMVLAAAGFTMAASVVAFRAPLPQNPTRPDGRP